MVVHTQGITLLRELSFSFNEATCSRLIIKFGPAAGIRASKRGGELKFSGQCDGKH